VKLPEVIMHILFLIFVWTLYRSYYEYLSIIISIYHHKLFTSHAAISARINILSNFDL